MRKTWLTGLMSMMTLNVIAANVDVTLVPGNGETLNEAVVFLTPQAPMTAHAADIAIMDQVNKQFLPHILVVQKGTRVAFPNSDSIKHHVYSFSEAKRFELKLYRDKQPEPMLFDTTGVVEMGCNIHDWMLGYIYVVDTPYFAQTEHSNTLSLAVPEGSYTLSVWHPRMQEPVMPVSQAIDVVGDTAYTIPLTRPLLPNLNEFENNTDESSDYE